MTNDECIAETTRELSQQRKRLRCLITEIDVYDRQLGRARAVLTMAQQLAREPSATIELQYPAADGWPSREQIDGLPEAAQSTALRIAELQQRLRQWDVLD